MIVFIAAWPIILVAQAMAVARDNQTNHGHASPTLYVHRPAETDSRRPADPTS